MAEEIQTQKNTVATVGMRFSISWLIAMILIILGFLCLFIKQIVLLWIILFFMGTFLWLFSWWILNFGIWFILWIIWLFFKPRKRARVAIIIPLLVFITSIVIWRLYVWNSVKTPAVEFANWTNENITPRLNWDLDENKFQQILTDEVNKVISSKTNDELKSLYENSTWSNAIERFSYLFFDLTKQWIENALNTYENTENQLEIIDEDTIDEVDDIIDENSDNEEIREPENQNSESSQTFSDNEMNDIEDLINILE